MFAYSRHLSARWIATWLAVFGLVFAPTLSRAMLVQGEAGAFGEICSSQGNRLLPGAAQKQAAEADAEGKLLLHLQAAHCPLCAVAAGDGLAPPPAPFALWLPPMALVAELALGPQPTQDLAPRTRPQPRAPPLSA